MKNRISVFLFLLSLTFALAVRAQTRVPLLGGLLSAAEPKTAAQPNILLIITDQQYAGMLSCAGNPYVKTPAMDSLAATGARFELAYSANPLCVPSRTSMLTGIMPSRIGLESNAMNNRDVRSNLTPEILASSMGNVFAKAGYETVYGGKQHVPMTIEAAGFRNIEEDRKMKLAKTSAEFLRQPHDKPFLLVSSFINPHDICSLAARDAKNPGNAGGKKSLTEALPPGMTPKYFFSSVCPPLPANYAIPRGEPENILVESDQRDICTYVRNNWTDEKWRIHRWAYARLTEEVDSEIGVVLAALRETGLDKNTLVVFVSDHGDMDASHHLQMKAVFYEEASRVPLIISWKGVTKPGLVDREHLVSTGLDLIPTMCDFAGIPVPPNLKGRSVRALAEGRTPPSWPKTVVTEGGDWRMLRSEHYKYTVYCSGANREMLTNMVKDPGEMKNLALEPEFAPVLTEHRQLLKEWYQQNGEKLDSKYINSEKGTL